MRGHLRQFEHLITGQDVGAINGKSWNVARIRAGGQDDMPRRQDFLALVGGHADLTAARQPTKAVVRGHFVLLQQKATPFAF